MDRRFVVGMLKDWGLALAIVVAVLWIWSYFSPGPPSGGTAPAFEVSDLDGNPVALADLQGDVVVLNFWATWCGPCVGEIPELVAFSEANPGVGVYGLSVDDGLSTAGLSAKSRKFGITYPVLHDRRGDAKAAYGVNGIPVTFVLDRDREIVDVIHGATNRERLERAVARAN